MSAPPEWDWSLPVFDHVDLHASPFAESVRFYETLRRLPVDPDGNNVEALYRDAGSVGHGAGASLR